MYGQEFSALLRQYMYQKGIAGAGELSDRFIDAGYVTYTADIVAAYLRRDPRAFRWDFVHACKDVLALEESQSFALMWALHMGPPLVVEEYQEDMGELHYLVS